MEVSPAIESWSVAIGVKRRRCEGWKVAGNRELKRRDQNWSVAIGTKASPIRAEASPTFESSWSKASWSIAGVWSVAIAFWNVASVWGEASQSMATVWRQRRDRWFMATVWRRRARFWERMGWVSFGMKKATVWLMAKWYMELENKTEVVLVGFGNEFFSVANAHFVVANGIFF